MFQQDGGHSDSLRVKYYWWLLMAPAIGRNTNALLIGATRMAYLVYLKQRKTLDTGGIR